MSSKPTKAGNTSAGAEPHGSSGASLSIDGLSVSVESVPLLNDISFELRPGEVLALVGPNGAGKSTLVKAIAGEQRLSSGLVQLHGRDMQTWDKSDLARHMAVLPQRSVLTFPFTGREVIELARTPHNTGAREDTRIVDEVIEYLDAVYLQNRIYPNMSGGEQQRIQLARVLAQIWSPPTNGVDKLVDSSATKNRVLILDEPSSYFDLAHQQLLVGLVRELADKGISIIVVLHDLNLALSCADRMAVLCCGRLHRIGPAQELLDRECIREVFNVDARFIDDGQTGRQHIVLGMPDLQTDPEGSR